MEKIVEGSRKGIPEFYIVIRKMKEEEQESFILLDKKERDTLVFQVRSFGYREKGIPKILFKVEVAGTWKSADYWDKKTDSLETET